MQLNEFFSKPEEREGYVDQSADNTVAKKSDTRKTRLTLGRINKLRQMNNARIAERDKRIADIQLQYGSSEEE